MTRQDDHEQARRLMDMERVEGLAAAERRWLQEHLADCEACAGWETSTEAALRLFKSAPVAVPLGLAESAKLRVRERVAELEQQRARTVALIVGCGLSWLMGVASAPLVWKACAWIGSLFDLPRIVWVLGFACWWLVPAATVGLLIAWAGSRPERENLGSRPDGSGAQSNGW